MGFLPTILGLITSLGIFSVALVIERRPREFGRVRLVPYVAILFVSLVAGLIFLARLFALLAQ